MKICYWDSNLKAQRERDATPEEIAEITARASAGPSDIELQAELRQIHLDAIGALLDDDKPAIAVLRVKAAATRAKLKKAA